MASKVDTYRHVPKYPGLVMTCVERHVSHELHRELPHGVTHCTNRLMNATVSAARPITGRNPHVFDRRLEGALCKQACWQPQDRETCFRGFDDQVPRRRVGLFGSGGIRASLSGRPVLSEPPYPERPTKVPTFAKIVM